MVRYVGKHCTTVTYIVYSIQVMVFDKLFGLMMHMAYIVS